MATTEDIDDLLATSERVVREAKEALARGEQFFADNKVDATAALEYLRSHEGEAAVQQVQAQVRAEVQSIESEVERQRMHAPKARPPGRRPRLPKNMV